MITIPTFALKKKKGLILDKISGCVFAIGINKLKSSYSGVDLRVRRSSDSSEQDFGFSGKSFDSSSALTFCGSGDGFVSKAYDLSGNGNHAEQTTASSQPKIIDTGVYNNGLLLPVGARYYLKNTSLSGINFPQNEFTIFIKAKLGSTAFHRLVFPTITSGTNHFRINNSSLGYLQTQAYNSSSTLIFQRSCNIPTNSLFYYALRVKTGVNGYTNALCKNKEGYSSVGSTYLIPDTTWTPSQQDGISFGRDANGATNPDYLYSALIFNRVITDSEFDQLMGAL